MSQTDRERFYCIHHIVLTMFQVKIEFETGATADIAASSYSPCNPVSVVSNVGIYPGQKEFSWGKLKSMHATGFLVPFLLLLQVFLLGAR